MSTIAPPPPTEEHEPATAERRPPGIPFALRCALAANAIMRIAGPVTGILLTVYYLPFINNSEYRISAFTVGALTAAFYLTELVFSPLLGALGDRRGRRVLLVMGPTIAAVALGLTAVSTLLVVLLATRLLEGLSTAASVPAILGQLSDETDHDVALRGRVLSIFEVTTALGTLVATAITTRLWLVLGRDSFWLVALVYLLAAALFLPSRDRRAPGQRARASGRSWRDSVALLAGQRALLRFLPAWLSLSAITGLWFTHALYQMRVIRPGFAGQYLAGRFAEAQETLEKVLLAYALIFCCGILAWGYFGLRRLPELVIMRIGLAAMLGVCATLWVVNHSGGNEAVRVAAIAIFGVLLAIESGFPVAAVAYLARLSSGNVATDRGLVMGLYTVVTGGGSFLGTTLGAPSAEIAALDGVLLATVLLAGFALALLLRQPPHEAGGRGA